MNTVYVIDLEKFKKSFNIADIPVFACYTTLNDYTRTQFDNAYMVIEVSSDTLTLNAQSVESKYMIGNKINIIVNNFKRACVINHYDADIDMYQLHDSPVVFSSYEYKNHTAYDKIDDCINAISAATISLVVCGSYKNTIMETINKILTNELDQ